MAKRFTDTSKWSKEKFQNLSPKMKLAWLYLCDTCDHAGIWEINIQLMSFQIGETYTLDDIKKSFDVTISGSKLYINSFIEFQYGKLNSLNKAHKSVIDRLEKLKIKGLYKPLARGCQAPKDKDKDKDMDKEKENSKVDKFDFEIPYQNYPKKIGKSAGIARLKKQIKTKSEYDDFFKAVINYKKYCTENQTEQKFIKQFSSFVGTNESAPWKDFINPPEAEIFPTESVAKKKHKPNFDI